MHKSKLKSLKIHCLLSAGVVMAIKIVKGGWLTKFKSHLSSNMCKGTGTLCHNMDNPGGESGCCKKQGRSGGGDGELL